VVPWGPGRAFAGLAALVGILLVEAVAVTAIDGGSEDLSTAATLVLQGALAITMVIVALAAANPGSGIAPASWLGLRRPIRRSVRISVIAYLVYIGCAVVIGLLLQPDQEDVTRELGVDEGTAVAILAGILIIVAAPISEEIFFRGFMFAGLRRSTPFWVAAAISSGIWGLFHYTGSDSWGVILQLSVFGVILAYLYERTGSIWPTIAVHAFNNAVAFAVLTS
jgi:membrane protease YdiL (CAAX protease family)